MDYITIGQGVNPCKSERCLWCNEKLLLGESLDRESRTLLTKVISKGVEGSILKASTPKLSTVDDTSFY